MRGRTKVSGAAVSVGVVVLSVLAPAAGAVGAGETRLVGGLPLPAGALSGGGVSGIEIEGPARVAVSATGRYVAFVSYADGLDRAALADLRNVFRKDLLTGEIALVSRATGGTGAPAAASGREVDISDDGSRVAWVTKAALDSADVDGGRADVYVRDLSAGTTTLATAGAADPVADYDLSGDGAWIAFATTTSLAGAADTGGRSDVYRRRLADGATALVSRRAGGSGNGNALAHSPSISDDGVWVAFASDATDLVPGFVRRGGTEIFARDMTAGRTHLLSSVPAQPETGAGVSADPQLAGAPASGALGDVKVAFTSQSTVLDPADTDPRASVYRRRLADDRARLVSRADGPAGAVADGYAEQPTISDDGRLVSFVTGAQNISAGTVPQSVYVRDTTAQTTAVGWSGSSRSAGGSLAGDGSTLAWVGANGQSADADPDLPAVFARSLTAGGPPRLASRPPGDAPLLAAAVDVNGQTSAGRRVSADGRWVVFSAASRRLPDGEDDLLRAYRRDVATGAVELVSLDRAGNPVEGSDPTISADGSRVAFLTPERVDRRDGNYNNDVYLRDLAAGTTTLVSRGDGPQGSTADGPAMRPRIAAGGRHVVWTSWAQRLEGELGQHVYLRDLDGGRTQLVDRAAGADGAPANVETEAASVSGDGRFVAFESGANNLDPADPPPSTGSDVFVRDTIAGTTQLISRREGADGVKATGASAEPEISADGRVVAFVAHDGALVPQTRAGDGTGQVFLRDRVARTTTLVSAAGDGAAGDADSAAPVLSGDGAVVAFESAASNLPGFVAPGTRRVVVRTVATGAVATSPPFGSLLADPAETEAGRAGAGEPALSDDGRCVAFVAHGQGPAAGDAGDFRTAYLLALADSCAALPPGGGGGGGGGAVTPGQHGAQRPGPGSEGRRRPTLSKASLLRARFRVASARKAPKTGRSAAARRRGGRRATAAGTVVRFTLGAPADVAIAVERRAAGRKLGRRCRPTRGSARRGRPCVRWTAAGTLSHRALAQGRRSLAFSGRIGRRALAPGRYRMSLTARNAVGRSAVVRLAFTVVRG